MNTNRIAQLTRRRKRSTKTRRDRARFWQEHRAYLLAQAELRKREETPNG